jgi:hypothetical protein
MWKAQKKKASTFLDKISSPDGFLAFGPYLILHLTLEVYPSFKPLILTQLLTSHLYLYLYFPNKSLSAVFPPFVVLLLHLGQCSNLRHLVLYKSQETSETHQKPQT